MLERGFFVLEGLDAAGKTTVASLLGEYAGIETIETPSPPLGDVKQRALESLPPLSRLLYFMSANFDIAERHVQLTQGRTVVVTRYIWSTIAYHAAIENLPVPIVVEPLRPLLDRLLLPEKVVFLKVSRAEQLRRLTSRHETGLARRLSLSHEFYTRLCLAYEATLSVVRVPTVWINTTELSVSETVSRVRAALRFAQDDHDGSNKWRDLPQGSEGG